VKGRKQGRHQAAAEHRSGIARTSHVSQASFHAVIVRQLRWFVLFQLLTLGRGNYLLGQLLHKSFKYASIRLQSMKTAKSHQ
jgi:hypothetical protein